MRREEFVTEVASAARSGSLAVLCGAGLSRPSGLPLAGELLRSILEGLSITPGEIEALLSFGLPFEAFMETVLRETERGAANGGRESSSSLRRTSCGSSL